MSRGHVVWNGIRYPIDGVRLAKGEVQVTFTIRGPIEPFAAPIAVYDERGAECWKGSVCTLAESIPAGIPWGFTYGMRIAEVYDTGPKVVP